jgi:hypothetical protein
VPFWDPSLVKTLLLARRSKKGAGIFQHLLVNLIRLILVEIAACRLVQFVVDNK